MAARRHAIGNANAEISEIETRLGMEHGMPILNPGRAVARLTQLRQQLTAKGPAGTPAAIAAAPSATAAVSEPEILTATLAEYRKMDVATRLQFAQDNGALSHADFSALSAQAKMNHCRNGGQVMTENRRHHCTAAASFNS